MAVVGVSSERRRFRHQQRLDWLIPRSSGQGTRDKERWKSLWGASRHAWNWRPWITEMRRTVPNMKKGTCMSGTCKGLEKVLVQVVLCIFNNYSSLCFQHPHPAFRDGFELQGRPRGSTCKLSAELLFLLRLSSRLRTAQLLLANGRDDNNTYWRLSPLARQQVVKTMPISTTTTNKMTSMTVTTTTTISRIVDDDL
jgi:hypothetical protein